MALIEVQFDTSALSNLLQSSVARAELDKRLRELGGVIVNNTFSFGQCFTDGANRRVRSHLRRLRELGFDRFGCTVSIHRIRVLELRGERLSGTPTLSDLPLHLALSAPDDLEAFDDLHADISAEILEKLDASVLLAADRRLAESFRDPSKAERQIRTALKGHLAESALELVRRGSMLLDGNLYIEDPVVRAQAHKDPRSFRAHMLSAGMVALHHLGCYLSDAHTPEYPWLKYESDNWNDINVVAVAAYAALIVTDDANMRGRVNFLRDRGLAFVRAVSLEAFLAEDRGRLLGEPDESIREISS